MTLKTLIKDMEILKLGTNTDMDIRAVNYDSRKVMPHDLFIALSGLELDGHDFILDALKRGASAVVCQKEMTNGIPFIRVSDTRDALALISNNFYGRPSERLTVTGITGTNGKTTTACLIKSILLCSGKKTGLIGTISYEIGESSYPASYTTPEALEFQGLLFEMLKAGCSHAVSEVSSHALSQKRVDYTRFKVATFTNLSRDHLDFHGTMENYFSAKKRLFRELLEDSGVAVINIDDPYAEKLMADIRAGVLTYGIESKDADLSAHDIKAGAGGLSFSLRHGQSAFPVESPMLGMPNVYNILSAVGACIAMGIGWQDITRAIAETGHPDGRFEKVDEGQDFLCIVDYAHTEDALRRLILTAMDIPHRRIITVFGCGGNRYRGKRPGMGRVASELSDIVFITSDNPRGERPMEIIKEIEAGISGSKNYRIAPDRKDAIAAAIMEAGASDIVLIAGKGHEKYQEIGGVRLAFSDKSAARDAIRKKIK